MWWLTETAQPDGPIEVVVTGTGATWWPPVLAAVLGSFFSGLALLLIWFLTQRHSKRVALEERDHQRAIAQEEREHARAQESREQRADSFAKMSEAMTEVIVQPDGTFEAQLVGHSNAITRLGLSLYILAARHGLKRPASAYAMQQSKVLIMKGVAIRDCTSVDEFRAVADDVALRISEMTALYSDWVPDGAEAQFIEHLTPQS